MLGRGWNVTRQERRVFRGLKSPFRGVGHFQNRDYTRPWFYSKDGLEVEILFCSQEFKRLFCQSNVALKKKNPLAKTRK